jgi:HEAT repeat protein
MRRVVALKVLTTHRRHDPAVVERFGREIEAAGKLSHPHIVTAHDAGEEDGMHYLVMELVEGVDLHTLVTQHGPLPVADACEIIRQAALGLQHAHEHGLVHRDLKPSNLMIAVKRQKSGGGGQQSGVGGRNGEEADGSAFRMTHSAFVKILDLGLARLQGDQVASEQITATGQVMGTLDYMAPEQADDSHAADIRSDIYALGCTLYKLLTGSPPFAGESYNSITKKLRGHAEDPPPPIREARSEVPDELAKLVNGVLAKSPVDRPATPADVATALQPFCDGCDLPTLVLQIDMPSQHDLNAASQAEIAMMLPTPKPTMPNRRRWFGIFAASAALMLLAVAAAGIVIAIQRGNGPTTTVEVPEGSEVKVAEDGGVAVTLPSDPPPVAGQAVNGLVVSFSVGSAQWKPGDEIELTCTCKNDSDAPVYVPRWGVTLPAMEITRLVDTRLAADAAAASVLRKSLQQRPWEPGATDKRSPKDAFVELPPGQTVSVTRRGVLREDGQLTIEWPHGVVQTWSLDNGRCRLTAILESRDDEQVLARLAREGRLENVWHGKARSGEVNVTVSGITRAPAEVTAVEPTYSGKSLSHWAAQLKDRDPRFREQAVTPLLSFGAAAVPPLVDLLRSGDDQSRLLALKVLEGLGADAKDALPALIEARNDPHSEVRYKAIVCLTELGTDAKEAIPALIAGLDDPDVRVRMSAVERLAQFGKDAPEALPALIRALDDHSSEVQHGAVIGVSKFGSDARQAVPALLRMLDAPEPIPRQAAVWGLWKTGVQSDEIVSALIRVAKGDDWGTQYAAACVLGEFADHAEKTMPVLVALVTDPRGVFDSRSGDTCCFDREILSTEDMQRFYGWGLPGAAMRSLVRLEEQEFSRIIEFSRHARPDIRQAAAQCLAHIDRRAAIDRLIEMLDDTEEDVAAFAGDLLPSVAKTRPSQLLAALSERDSEDRISVGLALAAYLRERLPRSAPGPVRGSARAGFGFGGEQNTGADLPEEAPPPSAEETFDEAIANGAKDALEFLRRTDGLKDRQHGRLRTNDRGPAAVALGLLDAEQAKQVLPGILTREESPEVRRTIVEVLRFLGVDVPEGESCRKQTTRPECEYHFARNDSASSSPPALCEVQNNDGQDNEERMGTSPRLPVRFNRLASPADRIFLSFIFLSKRLPRGSAAASYSFLCVANSELYHLWLPPMRDVFFLSSARNKLPPCTSNILGHPILVKRFRRGRTEEGKDMRHATKLKLVAAIVVATTLVSADGVAVRPVTADDGTRAAAVAREEAGSAPKMRAGLSLHIVPPNEPVAAETRVALTLKDGKQPDPARTAQAWGEAKAGLACSISAEKTTYRPGEPIPVRFDLNNVSEKSITVWHCGFWPNHKWIVQDEAGRDLRLTGRGRLCRDRYGPDTPRRKNAPFVVQPDNLDASYGPYDLREHFEIPDDATIHVRCVYLHNAAGKWVEISSNTLALKVERPAAAEDDGVTCEAIVPDRLWEIPENVEGRRTQVDMALRITNRTRRSLHFSRFDTVWPTLKSTSGKSYVLTVRRLRTRRPTAADFPLLKSGDSVTFPIDAHLYWENDKLRLGGDDGFGGIWYFHGIGPGEYQLTLRYVASESRLGRVVDVWDNERSEKVIIPKDKIWVGELQTAPVKTTLAKPSERPKTSDLP